MTPLYEVRLPSPKGAMVTRVTAHDASHAEEAALHWFLDELRDELNGPVTVTDVTDVEPPEPAAEDDALPVFSDYAAAVEWLLATDCDDLSARDIDFLESMRGILRRWPPRPKQARWIEALVERLGGYWND